MITLNNITMGFTQRTLFEDISMSVFKNEKIGLTGPNGAGKTTLFSIILGQMHPVAGSVQIQKNINIGYLPQEAHFDSSKTVIEELTEGNDRIQTLKQRQRKLEDDGQAASDAYGDILHELEQLGIYELENKAEKILSGLGFKEEDFDKPVAYLSGGWQMRTLLAKLLLYPYDLLLLDEPTNYLDLEATLWFKDFLSNYRGAFVLISHDRIFLNDVTNYTIILEGTHMVKLKGNYLAYEQKKETDAKSMEKRQKVVAKKRQQLERFAERFHAQANMASAVRNKRRMIDRLENIDLSRESKSVSDFEFSELKSSGYVVATFNQVSKSYGDKQVYKDIDFEVIRGQKICLVGPNGAGKSTLLKMLAGAITEDRGKIKYGHNVDLGYFSQSRLDVLSPNRTAFEEVSSAAPQGVQALKVRSLLGLFNFHGDDVFKTIKVLSGGEKSRVILAKFLINPPNFMLLDEPTTHLDLHGVKSLTAAFKKYEGTVVFISHDLFFIKEIADHIVDVHDGQLSHYPGGLEYYLDKKKQNDSAANEGKGQTRNHRQGKKKNKQNQKQIQSNGFTNPMLKELHVRHKQAIKRVTQIKNQIKKLDAESKELETESYVKSRKLSELYRNRDADMIKEYGQRLKEIQTRQRAVETTIKELREEKDRIAK